MDGNLQRIVKATFLAGLIPAVITPILFPFVYYFGRGSFPDWQTYPSAALAISFFALIIGLTGCMILGIPSLLVFEKFKINRPFLLCILGLIYSVLFYLLFGPSIQQGAFLESWPVLVFLGLLGAICGFVASYLSRPNKARHSDASRQCA